LCRCWWTQRFGSKLTFLQPKVAILDPEAGRTLGSLEVPKGALLGGVYAYIDHQDRMVFVDGLNTLLRVAHSADGTQVYVDERVPLNRFLSQYEGDQVVGVVPDWQGRVWVASAHGAIGVWWTVSVGRSGRSFSTNTSRPEARLPSRPWTIPSPPAREACLW